jgi:hypothetical protein
MTFTSEILDNGKVEFLGTKKMVLGKFENTTSAADGKINTGLRRIEHFSIQMFADSDTVPTISYPKIASFPIEAESVTIRASVGDGVWKAVGE